MRILVVTQYFWPENFRINDLVVEWLQRGHKVTVLTGVPNYPTGKIFSEYQDCPDAYSDYGGARIIRVPMLPRAKGGIRLFINYLSFVVGAGLCGPWLLRKENFDVIFVFEPSPITVGLPAILLSKIKKIPVVFWVLDLWPETLSALGVLRSKKLLAIVGLMVRFIYNRCTLVLGQSQGFLGSIKKYCNDESKVRYFPSWAEDLFGEKSHGFAPEVPYAPDIFTIVFAGNVGDAQDMPAVLTAMETLKDNKSIRWVIVGDGRKFDWLKSEVERRGLREQVALPGRFPVERMPEFYAHANALLVSLKCDPVFGMTIPGKVQSYLMSGIPILGMLDGEGANVIRDAKAGLICPAGDGVALASTASMLASMSLKDRGDMGINGRKYAEKEFERKLLMNRLNDLLCEAIDLSKTKCGIESKRT